MQMAILLYLLLLMLHALIYRPLRLMLDIDIYTYSYNVNVNHGFVHVKVDSTSQHTANLFSEFANSSIFIKNISELAFSPNILVFGSYCLFHFTLAY